MNRWSARMLAECQRDVRAYIKALRMLPRGSGGRRTVQETALRAAFACEYLRARMERAKKETAP